MVEAGSGAARAGITKGEAEIVSSANEAETPRPIIGTIENTVDPGQNVDILYWQEQNAFVTSGIAAWFAEREILVPAHLVIRDLELVGAIISTILDHLSNASEEEGVFQYTSRMEVLGETYTMTPYQDYMKLERLEDKKGLEDEAGTVL